MSNGAAERIGREDTRVFASEIGHKKQKSLTRRVVNELVLRSLSLLRRGVWFGASLLALSVMTTAAASGNTDKQRGTP
jgi:hypothetical protein